MERLCPALHVPGKPSGPGNGSPFHSAKLWSAHTGRLLVICLMIAHLKGSSSLSSSATKGMRHPIPLHVLKWSDKLQIQRWLDAAEAEITANGSKPLARDCDENFGMTYLKRWRETKKDVCLPGGQSTFSCFVHPPKLHHDDNVGSMVCSATNMVFNSEDFLGRVVTDKDRWPTPKKGSVRVQCPLASPLPFPRHEVSDQHTEKWLYDGLEVATGGEVSKACNNPATTVPYPVYFVTRMDPTNAFHHFEEVVNFFAALWLYPDRQLLQQGIAVVLLDGAVPGFYLELWRRMAYPYRVRFLRDRPYPPGTCFKHVLLAAMPHRSLYTHFWPGKSTTCRSVVFTALMNWAHALMADVRPESYTWPEGQSRQNADTVVGRVTWVSRRHFETALRGRGELQDWQATRAISNEDSLVEALAAAVRDWNGRSCLRNSGSGCRQLPVYFEFGSIELGDHRWYPDQLSLLSRTNVLVAVHGAGVFNEVWLRPATGATLEVTHNSGGNFHYRNIAAFLGLPYYEHGSADDLPGLAAKLTEVLDRTAERMAAVAARDRQAAEAAEAAAEAAERARGSTQAIV